mgnify:CR=1 FL=1
MSKQYAGIILRVNPDSLAEELELVPGDKILAINGQELRDIIDLSFALADEEIDMLVEHADGQQEMISFDKEFDEELGVEFESAVFDGIRNCANHCYFCFVDMIAPNMRGSLSVKDDDYRLSFLYGNFVTMTNMGPNDFKRIEKFHLSPLYVSVQCMNPDLRAQMLRCKGAAKIAAQLDQLEQAGAEYHTQVVLCSGLNDGAELERTIREIVDRRPQALSLAIVPVGITKFRDDPFPLVQFDAAGAGRVIDEVEKWQRKLQQENGKAKVELVTNDGLKYPQIGTLEFSDVTVDQTTGSITLRAIFPNPDHTLLPGMFVRARLEEGVNPDALLVPQQGVTRTPRGDASVMVVGEGDKVEVRQVTASQAIGDKWLVTDGLKTGDRVIVTGLQKIKPGVQVKAQEVASDDKQQAAGNAPSEQTKS